MDDVEAGIKNALKANPKDIAEQYESQLRELEEARKTLGAWFRYYNDHRPHQARK